MNSIRNAGVIPPASGTALRMRKGEILRLIDIQGSQVCDLFCYTDDERKLPLSSGRSIDNNDTILFGVGHTLYSNEGDPLLEILTDSCGRHDFLVTPCNLRMFQTMNRNQHYHPSCHENLVRALSPLGVDVGRIGTTFNAFMNVEVAESGKIRVLAPLSKAGDALELRALCDLIVGLTACADEGSNGGSCKPIGYELLSG